MSATEEQYHLLGQDPRPRTPSRRRALLATAVVVAVTLVAGTAIAGVAVSRGSAEAPAFDAPSSLLAQPISGDHPYFNPTYEPYWHFGGCNGESFVDGENYFKALGELLERAEREVLLTGWVINPEAILTDKGTEHNRTLISYLEAAVNRGVDVYVLFWNAPRPLGKDIFLKRVPEGAAQFEKVGVRVLLDSGEHFSPRWSQHQKTVILDRKYAFIGGLDVALGRWDSNKHVVLDPLRHERDTGHWDQMRDYMPWHDVQALVDGPAAAGIGSNFAQRWNRVCQRSSGWFRRKPAACQYSLEEMTPAWTTNMDGSDHFTRPHAAGSTVDECEVTRQTGAYGLGTAREQSSYHAYLDVIAQSERFIYMENQYFGSYPFSENLVTVALFERIKRALLEQKPFTVAIVIPAGITFAQYTYMVQSTILYDDRSIWKNLTRLLDEKAQDEALTEEQRDWYAKVDPADYLTFFYVASQKVSKHEDGHSSADRRAVYVHSKMLVADDRLAIVGSSNICDRSFDGDRDSEIGITVRPTSTHECSMDGQPWQCGEFASAMRRRLMAEHLDLKEDDPALLDFGALFKDGFRAVAYSNSERHRQVFGFDPRTASFKRDFKKVYIEGFQVDDLTAEQEAELGRVQGNIYHYPVDFWGETEKDSGVKGWINYFRYTEDAFR